MAGQEEAKYFCYIERYTGTEKVDIIYAGEPLSPRQAEDLVAQKTFGHGSSSLVMNTYTAIGGRITNIRQRINREVDPCLKIDASYPTTSICQGVDSRVFEGLSELLRYAADMKTAAEIDDGLAKTERV